MKLLIDECLSPSLAIKARAAGYGQSSHIVWLGRSGAKDWDLMPLIIGDDWTFVTKNSFDFRGPVSVPGSKGLYAHVGLHAGLICLNGPAWMDLDLQAELFDLALVELAAMPDMVNQVLEISLEPDDRIRLRRYMLPQEQG